MSTDDRGQWQKLFVSCLVDLGLSHDMAMLVMGKTCDLRQKAYMQGYCRGWEAAINQNKAPESKVENKCSCWRCQGFEKDPYEEDTVQ